MVDETLLRLIGQLIQQSDGSTILLLTDLRQDNGTLTKEKWWTSVLYPDG